SVIELAHSAARSHRLYLEQLSSVGAHAAVLSEVRGQLTKSATVCERLAEAEARLSTQLAESESALRGLGQNKWVRLGAAVGMVRSNRDHKNELVQQSRAVKSNASASSRPLPNLR